MKNSDAATEKPLADLSENARLQTEALASRPVDYYKGQAGCLNGASIGPRLCPHVYVAINAVMAELSKLGISKDRRNQQGAGYNFRGVDDVLNALSPLLVANKLMMLPRAVSRTQQERQAKSGGALYYTDIVMEYDLVSAVDGSKHTVSMFGEAMDSSDKSTNKAESAAFKYVAFQLFCIPVEGMDDADHDSPEASPSNGRKSNGNATSGASQKATQNVHSITEASKARFGKLRLSIEGESAFQALMKEWKLKDVDELTEAEAQEGLNWIEDEMKFAAPETISKARK
jgi:hypothetical protein